MQVELVGSRETDPGEPDQQVGIAANELRGSSPPLADGPLGEVLREAAAVEQVHEVYGRVLESLPPLEELGRLFGEVELEALLADRLDRLTWLLTQDSDGVPLELRPELAGPHFPDVRRLGEVGHRAELVVRLADHPGGGEELITVAIVPAPAAEPPVGQPGLVLLLALVVAELDPVCAPLLVANLDDRGLVPAVALSTVGGGEFGVHGEAGRKKCRDHEGQGPGTSRRKESRAGLHVVVVVAGAGLIATTLAEGLDGFLVARHVLHLGVAEAPHAVASELHAGALLAGVLVLPGVLETLDDQLAADGVGPVDLALLVRLNQTDRHRVTDQARHGLLRDLEVLAEILSDLLLDVAGEDLEAGIDLLLLLVLLALLDENVVAARLGCPTDRDIDSDFLPCVLSFILSTPIQCSCDFEELARGGHPGGRVPQDSLALVVNGRVAVLLDEWPDQLWPDHKFSSTSFSRCFLRRAATSFCASASGMSSSFSTPFLWTILLELLSGAVPAFLARSRIFVASNEPAFGPLVESFIPPPAGGASVGGAC